MIRKRYSRQKFTLSESVMLVLDMTLRALRYILGQNINLRDADIEMKEANLEKSPEREFKVKGLARGTKYVGQIHVLGKIRFDENYNWLPHTIQFDETRNGKTTFHEFRFLDIPFRRKKDCYKIIIQKIRTYTL